jgi:integrase
MSLTDTAIRKLRPGSAPLKLSDGGGLFLYVSISGSKLWRMAYRHAGKQKLLSFGAYPTVTLAAARKRRDQAKELLASGVDPGLRIKREKFERLIASGNTFAAIADEFLDKVGREGRADVTLGKKRWLLGMAKSAFGTRPIRDITPADILVPLKKVERSGNLETAKRLRATIGQVFRFAIATSRADVDPAYGLRGAIAAPLVTHRAALTDAGEFARLVRAVWTYDGQPETRIALQLLVLLYPRPGELRQAKWVEFDLDRKTWDIPPSTEKMRRGHRKTLSDAAVAILKQLRDHTGHRELAFYSSLSPGKPMSENTMNDALRRMGFSSEEATAHGFRVSASSLLNESGLWSPDAIEVEQGRAVGGGPVRKVYHRGRYWDERVRMCEWWAGQVERMLNDYGEAISCPIWGSRSSDL